jgi:hypothetical protein
MTETSNDWPQALRSRAYPQAIADLRDPPPKILSNEPAGPDLVYVTWSLPGLRRALMAVPAARWQEGGHVSLGKLWQARIAALDLQAAAISATMAREQYEQGYQG